MKEMLSEESGLSAGMQARVGGQAQYCEWYGVGSSFWSNMNM
jgi:hypothetical protein